MTDITPERLALVWLDDANYDLAEANKLFEAESYPWCCFIASTSAEKSLKALIYRFEDSPEDMRHHVLLDYYLRLLPTVPEMESIQDAISVFETYSSYVRYVDNAQLSPARFRYDRSKAEEALEAAEQILEASKRIFQKASEILKSS